MVCEVGVDGKLSSSSQDITGQVTTAPIGLALISIGATVDFDSFTLCPEP